MTRQILRLVDVSSVVDISEVCERGKTYAVLCSHSFLGGYLDYFTLRGHASIVFTKTTHVKKMQAQARVYFQAQQDYASVSSIENTLTYVRTVANNMKMQARAIATRRKQVEEAVKSSQFLFPADFSKCLRKADKALNGIMESQKASYESALEAKIENYRSNQENHVDSRFKASLARRTRKAVVREMTKNRPLVQKWRLNLLARPVLTGGGRIPQV